MDKNTVGRIHSFESFGAVDGPGVRFVVFFQGCPLRCLYCHNPDSWDMKSGRLITANELTQEILRYRSFIKSGGVTLSGGEPLAQPEFAEAVLEKLRENKIHTAVDTSGCIPLSKCKNAVDKADLLLLDIKSINPDIAKKITSSEMSGALKLLDYREQARGKVWIRHVLVPGLTLDTEQAHRMGEFLSRYKCVEKVELLPFHKFGEYKWEQLGIEYTLADVDAPKHSEVAEMRIILEEYGLEVSTTI